MFLQIHMMNVNSDLHDLEQMPVPAVNSTSDITHTEIEISYKNHRH